MAATLVADVCEDHHDYTLMEPSKIEKRTCFLRLTNLEARGKRRELAWQGAWHENSKGTTQPRSSCQRGQAGLKLGHVGMVNIQTYTLSQCMFAGTGMRTYHDCGVLLHE